MILDNPHEVETPICEHRTELPDCAQCCITTSFTSHVLVPGKGFHLEMGGRQSEVDTVIICRTGGWEPQVSVSGQVVGKRGGLINDYRERKFNAGDEMPQWLTDLVKPYLP